MAETTEEPTLKRARSEQGNAPQLADHELVGYKPDPLMVWIFEKDNKYYKYEKGALAKVDGRGGIQMVSTTGRGPYDWYKESNYEKDCF